ncbi:MAG: aspartate/methionine/tyrosine aminotransferase [Oceanicoccus sp.]|jgi:aspartate/methionine/tyrosine aminotransferase
MLQAIALEHNDEKEIIDLSQGKALYSVRAREFASYLGFLDTKYNKEKRGFINSTSIPANAFLEEIASWTRSTYVPAVAERYLKDLSEFIQRAVSIAKKQGFDWTPYEVMKALFKKSMWSPAKEGELISRLVATWHRKKTIGHLFNENDLVLSDHVRSSLFKLLGQEGIQFLSPGDKVLVTSPTTSDLRRIIEKHGLEAVNISIKPMTGEIEAKSLDLLKKTKNIKLIALINPSESTGFAMSEHTLKYLGDLAEKHDALILCDESLNTYFQESSSMVDIQPKRTLSYSGSNIGNLLITQECNDYLTRNLMRNLLPIGLDFKKAFIDVIEEKPALKFNPIQVLNLAQLLLGEEDSETQRKTIAENNLAFTETLSLPHEGNRAYIMFDLNLIEGNSKKDISAEEKTVELAKLGVILHPANLFFSKENPESEAHQNMVRACLLNYDSVKTKTAAKVIRDYLTS